MSNKEILKVINTYQKNRDKVHPLLCKCGTKFEGTTQGSIMRTIIVLKCPECKYIQYISDALLQLMITFSNESIKKEMN